ncbi:MAG: glycosyltransferase family 4 protein [Xenococcaceae cyanobacterium]
MNSGHHVFVFLEIFAGEGGIQSYVKDILQAYKTLVDANELNVDRAEVFLLRDRAESDNPYNNDSIEFHYLQTKIAWIARLQLVTSLLTCLLLRRPQRVFCGHINLVPLISLFCRPLGIPYTVLTYGKEVWETLPPLQQKALKKADCIWTISRYSRDRLTAANHIDPRQVRILPCVVDENVFTPGIKSPKLLEKYGLADAKVLMTVARLWSGDIYKGVDVTIRALPKIVNAFPEVKYLVIGRGDDLPRLIQLTKDLEVRDRVVFAGFVPNDELVEHYRIADAYIMPSQEGFGIVYLEAMACGIPVLSGDDDGSADPLQNGLLGWRVPHRDPTAVADACIEILQQGDRRCDGQWLREQTLAKFGREALVKQLKILLSIDSIA